MERLSQKENSILNYTLQRSLTNPTSSPSRNSDDDFHDVFGGPPRRRSSIYESRYSFTETLDSFAAKGDDEALVNRSSSLSEKPVFGEEIVNRRRNPSDDFYDDIFKGDESVNSPRKHDRDVFSSLTGSRALSPTKPLPPAAEPFGSSSQLSLPTKLAKGTDLPPFGSSLSSPYKPKDSASNGSHANSPRLTLSRFSSLSSQGPDDLKSDHNLSNRTGIFSSEFRISGEEAPSLRKSENSSSGNNLMKGLDSSEDPTSQFQFHFSIYKWASKGVPLMMPLRRGNGSKLKEKQILKRSSSAKEGTVKEKNEKHSPTSTMRFIDFPPLFHETENYNAFRAERIDLLPEVAIEDERSPCQNVEETISAGPSESTSSQSALEDVGYNTVKHQTMEKVEPRLPENVLSEKAEKKMTLLPKEDQKHDAKSLSSFLLYDDGEEGEKGISGDHSKEEIIVKSDKKSSIISRLSGSLKKREKETFSRNLEENVISSDMDSGQNIGRKKVGGKVSEFVKIFNQEPTSKLGDVVDSENQSSRRKKKDTSKAPTEATVDKGSKDEKSKLNNNKDSSIKVDDIFKQSVDDISKLSVDDHSAVKAASYISSSTSSKQDSSASNTVSIPDGSKFIIPDMEEPFQEHFMIKELPQDYDDLRGEDNGSEELKVIDGKIRKWSNGKEGNIRSLLSTLQYVLWPESGWKPVPLVDIIEGNAVKRSYQKALLYLHPDKLQQKGASSNQKYIAAKVFDILQEAWTHFNTLGGL